jgi:hypothetical protein
MNEVLTSGMSRVTGKMVSIDEAKNGKNCNCICAECRETLIARQGENNQWHFAHLSGKTCTGAIETALHRLAKQIVAENNWIRLPDGKIFNYSERKQEAIVQGLRADVLISNEAETILVEIFVTHKIKTSKEQVIIFNNLKVLEIDLSDIDRNISKIELKQILIDQGSRKRIIQEMKESPADNESNWLSKLAIAAIILLAVLVICKWVKILFHSHRYKYT